MDKYMGRLLSLLKFVFPKWDPGMVVLASEQLISLYTYYGGAYHNLDHIKHCVKELYGYPFMDPGHQTSVKLIELALWYHDAIYIPGRKDNEERSAHWFHSYSMISLDSKYEDIEQVLKLIRATKHDVFPNTSRVEQIIVDIDLSILGQSLEIYNKYAAGIQEEFCPEGSSDVKLKGYKFGRQNFLYTLLPPHRASIYQTEFFKDKYEKQAVENIRGEIEKCQ